MRVWLIVLGVLVAIIIPSTLLAAEPDTSDAEARQLVLEHKPWKGDFDGMMERRLIRVLVPYSRTLFFTDKGRQRGMTAELAQDFEQYINKKYKKQLQKRPITVVIIPTTRDKLMSMLVDGLGDISAGNLTATPDRQKIVDFVAAAGRPPVRELLITGPSSPAVGTLDDLSGKTVSVRPSSSYHESLIDLSAKLARAGKPPVNIVLLPDALEDEDELEMLNAGILQLVVVDDWVAKLWVKVLPKIRVRDDIVLRNEDYTGWAIRKDSPLLKETLDGFYVNVVKKQGLIEYRLATYHKHVKQIADNTKGQSRQRFEKTLALFEKYGQKYDFDPLMLVAQGYQESRLDQNAKSHVGAIGVMQIMPATGAELRVGDIHQLEPNIHGGAKYMDQLMTKYFPDAHFSESARPLFAFASYNCGPGNISKMRKTAEKRGLDPNEWFNNVELVVADRIGMETTTYVRNIFKYYVAYKIMLEAQEAQRKARESVAPVKPGD
jgi:membrane-bound lytic murein transglycosylase MltF